MLVQFTDEEIEEFKKKDSKKEKIYSDFHFISKKELDDKINPFSKLYREKKGNKKLLFKIKINKRNKYK